MTKPVTFTPLKREPAYIKVSRAIETQILEGKLKDGVSLPIEASLCEQFQVTRSTVREGLRILQQSGLIERGPHKKFYVSRPSSNHVAKTASRSLALGGATFGEVWEALSTFYPEAAALAATRLVEDDISRLKASVAKLETCDSQDYDLLVETAVDFFQITAVGLGNRVQLALLQSLNMMIYKSVRYIITDAPNARERMVKAQTEMISAYQAGEQDKAREWMGRHIDDLKRGLEVANVDLAQTIIFSE